MKTIGMLGGTAWPSTIAYYRYLNQLAQQAYGPLHSARLILKSIDYAPIVACYANDWPMAVQQFQPELAELFSMQPSCIMVCCNTLHRAVDELADCWPANIPIIHMVDETARVAVQSQYKRVLLLGTQFTMENGYYAERLLAAGLAVEVPDSADRRRIQQIQTAIAGGDMPSDARAYFKDLLARFSSCDAAILACTELPSAVDVGASPLPLLDPLTIQCDAAFAFATSD